jgi:carbonic anhydrase
MARWLLLEPPQNKVGVSVKGALLSILGIGIVSSPFWVKPDYYRSNAMSSFPQENDCAEYSYKNPTEDWSKVTCRFGVQNQCGETNKGTQSPIDIPKSACQESRSLDGSEGFVQVYHVGTTNYGDTVADQPVCSVSDLTSTLVSDVTAKTYYNFNDTCINPMIYVEDLPESKQCWELQQLHFHTGGSEHKINGERFEGELHMVHKSESSGDDDLLVIAVLLTSSTNYSRIHADAYYYENQRAEEDAQTTTNAYLEPLLQYYESLASNIKNTCNVSQGVSVSSRTKDAGFVDSNFLNHGDIDVSSSSRYDYYEKNGNEHGYDASSSSSSMDDTQTWSPYKLLPSGAGAYAYEGSLTTPPCSTGVQWVVADTPLYVSEYQMQRLASVMSSVSTPSWPSCEMSSSGSELLDTFRPTQSRGRRVVQHDCSLVSS